MLIWCLELYSSCAMLNHFNRKNFCCYAVFYNNTFLIQGHFLSHHPSCFGEFKLIFPILFYRRLWKWRHLKSGFPCMHWFFPLAFTAMRQDESGTQVSAWMRYSLTCRVAAVFAWYLTSDTCNKAVTSQHKHSSDVLPSIPFYLPDQVQKGDMLKTLRGWFRASLLMFLSLVVAEPAQHTSSNTLQGIALQ